MLSQIQLLESRLKRSSPAPIQGATLEEPRENLQEAATLILEANRELAEKSLAGQNVVRESFDLEWIKQQMANQ
jgi:hypothetical protein